MYFMFPFLLKIAKINSSDRKAVGYFEGWMSIAVNTIISAIKFIYGIISGSVSLLADAVHSLSDVLSSVIVIFTFKFSSKGADTQHPFGYGRIENIASIIIATLLMVVGFEFLIDSVQRILSPQAIKIDIWGLVLITLTIFLKEFLARLAIFLGKLIDSPPLIAEGYHHRSDALSTIIVIIAFIGNNLGFAYADGIAGLLVSLFLFHTAWDLIKESSQVLIGEKPDPEIIKYIKEVVSKYDKVFGVHDIIVHKFGQVYNISLHIEVPDDIDIVKAHEIADKIEKGIGEKYKGHVIVHLDPVNTSHPMYHDVVNYLRKEVGAKYPFFETAHDVRVVGDDKFFNIVFDINVPQNESYGSLFHEVKNELKKRFGANDVSINIDLPL
jgi:cation diffusion facilitator family transporter